MASTKFTTTTRKTWAEKEKLLSTEFNSEWSKVQQGIQAHRHTETNTDTDSLDTGNALQIDGNDEIKNGSIKLSATLGSITTGDTAGGLNGKIHNVTDSGTATVEFTIAHGLGRVPVGYIVISINKNTTVYRGTTAWNSTNIYLACSASNVNLWVLVF